MEPHTATPCGIASNLKASHATPEPKKKGMLKHSTLYSTKLSNQTTSQEMLRAPERKSEALVMWGQEEPCGTQDIGASLLCGFRLG